MKIQKTRWTTFQPHLGIGHFPCFEDAGLACTNGAANDKRVDTVEFDDLCVHNNLLRDKLLFPVEADDNRQESLMSQHRDILHKYESI